jgi:hypothetical protein
MRRTYRPLDCSHLMTRSRFSTRRGARSVNRAGFIVGPVHIIDPTDRVAGFAGFDPGPIGIAPLPSP